LEVTIDWSISIGSVVGGLISGTMFVFGLYGAALKFWHHVDIRVGQAENVLKDHSETLIEHSRKMEKHEGRMVDVMQDVATLFGNMNLQRRRGDG
jgi:hypothetical protein